MAMNNGYAGKLLFVDLSTGTITIETPAESFYRAYIGGTGIGARILMERSKPGVDPLSPHNMLWLRDQPHDSYRGVWRWSPHVGHQVTADRRLGGLQLWR